MSKSIISFQVSLALGKQTSPKRQDLAFCLSRPALLKTSLLSLSPLFSFFCDQTPKAPFCTHNLLGVLHFQASCQLGLPSLYHTISVWRLRAMANRWTHSDTSPALPSVTSSSHHLHSVQVSVPTYRICFLLPSAGCSHHSFCALLWSPTTTSERPQCNHFWAQYLPSLPEPK